MNETATIEQASSWRGQVVNYLSLERNVSIASAAVFILGLGEELWKKFLPKYLEALGATMPVIGLFGTAQDFFDAVYQYPGGWIADRVGRRRALLMFVALASAGYIVYLLSPSWPFVFLGLALVMAWQSMASPAIFAIIGDALPRERRAMGFTLQSILKRVPIAIAGLYYLVRSLSITPAALVGGLLWSIAPEVPFIVAGLIGLIGTFVFAATVEEKYAG
jgi:MFS family permease